MNNAQSKRRQNPNREGSSLNNPQVFSDLHQQVTDQIIQAMEQSHGAGRALWQGQDRLPVNLSTDKAYSGINVLILWSTAIKRGYASPYWLTYKQAQDMGGQVRKGEASTLCAFYKPWENEGTNDQGETETKRGAILKSFRVFNLNQIDGIEVPTTEHRPDFDPLAAAEALLQSAPVPVHLGGARACYSSATDSIYLPTRETFISREAFYSVACHEMTHSTGHKSRLDRDLTGRFGDESYAMEELVAELGAAFLCAELGILPATREDHAHYLTSWVRVLKSDKKAIFTAAAQASKAAAFIREGQAGQVAA